MPTRTKALKIKAATWNSLTLKEQEDGRERGLTGREGRRAIVQQSFREKGYQIVGLQETRSGKGAWTGDFYHVISSGAQDGKYGNEIWVAREWEVKGKKMHVKLEECQVIDMDARTLMVCLRARDVALDIFCGHAPHSQHTKEDQAAWWNAAQKMVDARPSTATPLLGLIDANAHLAKADNVTCGTSLAKKTNEPGRLFTEFMFKNGLCAASTFAHCNPNPKLPTFIARGAATTIDYVLWPQKMMRKVIT